MAIRAFIDVSRYESVPDPTSPFAPMETSFITDVFGATNFQKFAGKTWEDCDDYAKAGLLQKPQRTTITTWHSPWSGSRMPGTPGKNCLPGPGLCALVWDAYGFLQPIRFQGSLQALKDAASQLRGTSGYEVPSFQDGLGEPLTGQFLEAPHHDEVFVFSSCCAWDNLRAPSPSTLLLRQV